MIRQDKKWSVVACILVALFFTETAQASKQSLISKTPGTVEKTVRTAFARTPILIKIAKCESQFRQFDEDGSVLRGKVDKRDTGVMQINTKYHAKSAAELGFDITTTEGNIAYAKYLYKHQGTSPWKASKSCWG